MDVSSTCVCKERVESARGQGGSVGSKAAISLAVLALAQLGVSADNGAFSVAMSEMMRVFGCSVADVQLANTVYALMAGTFMLASGLFGLMVGWRRTFVGGMVLIVIGEIVTALAPVVELLIWGGRLAVGVGASLVIPSVLGMVPLLFEGDKRKQAYGVIAGSAALATIVPIPLGMLVDNFGFRFTFGALVAYFGALVAASLALPASQPRASKKFDLVGAALASMGNFGFRFTFGALVAYFGALVAASLALPASQPRASKKFDLVGAALASMGLFAVMFGLSRISAWGVADPLPTAPFTIFGLSPAPFIVIAGMVLLIVLVPVELWMERAHDVAILPSSFIKSAQVRSGVVAIALPFFYMGAQGLVATSFYQLVVGLGGTSTALLGIVSGVPMLVLAMGIPRKFPQANSWLVVRCGYVAIALGAIMAAFGVRGSELTSIMVLGTLLGVPMLVLAMGIPRKFPQANSWLVVRCGYIAIALGAIMAAFGVRSSELTSIMVHGTLLSGIGVGMVNSQSNNLVASAVPAHDAQQSGGIQGAARNLGLALGSAAMGSVMLIAVNMGLDARVESMAVLDEPVRTALEQTVYTYEGIGRHPGRGAKPRSRARLGCHGLGHAHRCEHGSRRARRIDGRSRRARLHGARADGLHL